MTKLSSIREKIKRSAKKTFYLKNEDFKEGFLRIVQPGIYKLSENIVLDIPEVTIENYIFHSFEQEDFNFGIHAGIMIETDNVIIDLCGYKISQSVRFYSSQRFFNLIQFNNFPFIPKKQKSGATQGPITKTSLTHFSEPSNIIVRNGTLSLSSHNSIHGNNNKNIGLENLIMEEFEVAGVTLNNCDTCVIENCTIRNSLQTVPFNTFYNTVLLFLRSIHLFSPNHKNSSEFKLLLNKVSSLFPFLDKAKTLKDILKYRNHNKFRPFSNYTESKPNWKSICGQYGISITGKGIGIHDFAKNKSTSDIQQYSKNIHINNLTIENIEASVNEFLALTDHNSTKPLGFVTGSLISPEMLMKDHLAKHMFTLLHKMNENTRKIFTPLQDNQLKNIVRAGNPYSLCYLRGLDNMGHVSKGIVCIRMDNIKSFSLKNIKIKQIYNDGMILPETTLSKFTCKNISVVPNNLFQDDNYIGNYSQGILLSACCDGRIEDINVQSLLSPHGTGIGVFLNNGCSNVKMESINLFSIDIDNKVPSSFIIDNDCVEIFTENINFNT